MAARTKIVILLGLALSLGGCAVNRVEEVHSARDASSMYKVPVIYGIAVAENSLPLRGAELPSMRFSEYDPVTKKGTASCLGSADDVWISFRMGFDKFPQDHNLHYHVLMVPSGYDALSMGVKPYEANPSLYFKIEQGRPQYLGDFLFKKSPSTQPNDQNNLLARTSTLPVEYHKDEAINVLQKFGIPTDQLENVPLIPTDGGAEFLLCTP
jgi:hypothetical protein